MLRIEPSKLSPDVRIGRSCGLNIGSATRLKVDEDSLTSSINLHPSDEPVYCTLEHVSLQDVSSHYAAYIKGPRSQTWEDFCRTFATTTEHTRAL